MKRKTIHMILLPLVGAIWLTVIMRIFWQEGPSQPVATGGGSALAFVAESAAPDSLRLSLAYDDPFFQQARPVRQAAGPERTAVPPPQPPAGKSNILAALGFSAADLTAVNRRSRPGA